VERTLYVASLQLGMPEFVGVWMALKVAGQWKRWGEDGESSPHKIEGRSYYNIFLIGSGLSVAFAVVGAQMVEALANGNWQVGVGLPLTLLISTYVLSLVIDHYQK
jgi:hypothetical protein